MWDAGSADRSATWRAIPGPGFVGINNNAYQIERAKHHTRDVESLCRFIRGDYMQIPEDDESYDAAFAIESMPHAPDKAGAFREVLRVLRPGASFRRLRVVHDR